MPPAHRNGVSPTRTCVVLIALGIASDAAALKPGVHADITVDRCRASGLPGELCLRAATENYNTDAREWKDLRAHAQIDGGQTACRAADRAAARLWSLGEALRLALDDFAVDDSPTNAGRVASALGRALHTIQDNCAHRGMPNPEHAWLSTSDLCEGTDLSPDVQDAAVACARAETDAVVAVVAGVIDDAGLARPLDMESCEPPLGEKTTRDPCRDRFLPDPIAACDFLAAAGDWDGVDRGWENRRVVPALREAFAAGLAGAAAPAPLCGGDETALAPETGPDTDVSGGPASCKRLTLFCLGKADEADHPFADDEPAAGCSASGHPDAPLWLLLLAAIPLVERRRR